MVSTILPFSTMTGKRDIDQMKKHFRSKHRTHKKKDKSYILEYLKERKARLAREEAARDISDIPPPEREIVIDKEGYTEIRPTFADLKHEKR
jgi:hypothetical protein